MVAERFAQGIYFDNLGISYSSPTFTIHGYNGDALSTLNPGVVVLPSVANPGQFIRYQITANLTFDDDSGTSHLTGNLWGTTTAVAWANAMPFYIYAVAKDSDAACTFMISRVPHRKTAPAAGNIAKSGSAVASTQGSFFALDSSITVGDWDGNPCACLGSFTMAKNDAANDDWTVQTISANDGFGLYNDSTIFTMPTSQNGAASGKYFKDNGGTAPSFTTNLVFYTYEKNGITSFDAHFSTATAGVGAVNARCAAPIESHTSYGNGQQLWGVGFFGDNSGGTNYPASFFIIEDSTNISIIQNDINATTVTNVNIDTSDSVRFNIKYLTNPN